MSKKKQLTIGSKRYRVALWIESSMASGRQVLNGIAEYLHQTNFWSIYFEPGHYAQNIFPDWLKHWHGDGILARIRNRKVAKMLRELGVPIVDLMGDLSSLGIPSVVVDHQKIAELAANHLWECRFRTFGFCGIRGAEWPKLRQEYFSEEIARFDCKLHTYWLPMRNNKTWSSNAERKRLSQWMLNLPKPVGIMACNDMAGQRVLEACRQAGVMVPEEAAVIGVDNDEAFCNISDPMLSSVVAGHEQVGFHGAELLDHLMQGKSPPCEPMVVGLPNLIVRQSTDVQTIEDRDLVVALRFIRENACSSIGVKDIANHVALSYSTLNRRFHHFLSRSINDEITRVRIERVCKLLTETQLTLSQIARVTGFANHEYLGTLFKSKMGTTPGQFRDKLRRHNKTR